MPVANPFGPVGAPSANAPPMQFSLRARYEWNVAGYTPFVQVGATHSGHSFTQAGSNPTIAQAGGLTHRPGCASRIPPTRPTMRHSASPRMPGT